MYQIGSVVAIPFIGPAIDTWGRKVGIYIGSTSFVLGTIIQSTTLHSSHSHFTGQFMGGRFLLGLGEGGAIMASAGPMYVVETPHPAYRGIVTAVSIFGSLVLLREEADIIFPSTITPSG
jgi:MFS family permease